MTRSLLAEHPWSELRAALRGDGLVLIGLDIDGTLAPIVAHPSRVRVLPRILRALRRCARAKRTRVAIVSARPLSAIRRLLPVAGLHRAGQYGLEGAAAPSARRRAAFRRAAARLGRRAILDVGSIPGAWVERKGLTVAIHDRAVASARLPALRRIVRGVSAEARRLGFRPLQGRRVTDFVPAGFDKGTALHAIIRAYRPERTLYIGDSPSDERAFRVLGPGDFPVHVGPGATRAPFRVEGPDDVARVLSAVVRLRAGAAARHRR